MSNIQKDEKISSFLSSPKTQEYLNNVLGAKKERFVTNLASIVSQDKALQECTNVSIMSGAIVATTLNLSLNKSFGYAYLVPYKVNKWNEETRQREHIKTEAQFQIGYKGYIQLAMRTGEYRRLNAAPVYENQLIKWNEFEEELSLNYVDGDGEIVGYMAFFELMNGFKKVMYFTRQKMMKHASEYASFSQDEYERFISGQIAKKDLWKYSSNWYKDFDGMSIKTMLRQILGKYGILNEEMQTAYEYDQSSVKLDGKEYIDNRKRINIEQVEPQHDPMQSEDISDDEIIEVDFANV